MGVKRYAGVLTLEEFTQCRSSPIVRNPNPGRFEKMFWRIMAFLGQENVRWCLDGDFIRFLYCDSGGNCVDWTCVGCLDGETGPCESVFRLFVMFFVVDEDHGRSDLEYMMRFQRDGTRRVLLVSDSLGELELKLALNGF